MANLVKSHGGDVPKPRLSRSSSNPSVAVPFSSGPARPSSATEQSPPVKSRHSFPFEVVQAMRKILGFPDDGCEEFTWVIRDCLISLQEEGWLLRVQEKDAVFVHAERGEVRSTLSYVELYQGMTSRLVDLRGELSRLRQNPTYRVKELVWAAVEKVACPSPLQPTSGIRSLTNPSLLEKVMSELKVSTTVEPYLVECVRIAIEDTYILYLKNRGLDRTAKSVDPWWEAPTAHACNLRDCMDCDRLIVNMQIRRMEYLKQLSPCGLLYCVECKKNLADVGCATCRDVLCVRCFHALHSTGNRLDHPAVFLEQLVCSECESNAAPLRCKDCEDLFCKECFTLVHSKGKKSRHAVALSENLYCYECGMSSGLFMCLECEDVMCSTCCRQIHRSGGRQTHAIYGLRKALYAKPLFANNLAELMRTYRRSVERTISIDGWQLFYRDGTVPYWYDFITKREIPGEQRPSEQMEPKAAQAIEEYARTAACLRRQTGATNLFDDR